MEETMRSEWETSLTDQERQDALRDEIAAEEEEAEFRLRERE